ncbi:TetR/AcrR family transcriptional regulator [Hymenobacter siberiensis]|uniref:TetR/AcrR family transcriptional regulator n=1 Tax=Hymenobacter siberiensis TaxID=2848396 RepID=UPI001C1DFF8C|nr:TetR/AcrR family transcriptional regulator [Hymenobacter siberiensis]MBU6119691.1 TetR/AcrR family transcriptional regulator [Hymenobacter siberiensis]
MSTPSLEAAISVFYRYGLRDASDAALAKALNTTEPDLAAQFPSRELLVHQVMLADMECQKREHVALYVQYSSAVERLYGLLQLGLRDLAAVPGQYYGDLQTGFPLTWDAVMEQLNSYSPPSFNSCSTTKLVAICFVNTLIFNCLPRYCLSSST